MWEIVHLGDPQALQERKEAAKFDAIVEKLVLPLSSDEWLHYLAQQEERFREKLPSACQQRAGIAAARIYPEATPKTGHSPEWANLKDGHICYKANPEHQLLRFVAAIGLTVYAIPLAAPAARARYDLLFGPPVHRACRPIALVLEAAGFHDEVEAYRLDVDPAVFAQDKVTLDVVGAEVVTAPSGGPFGGRKACDVGKPPAEDDDAENNDLFLSFPRAQMQQLQRGEERLARLLCPPCRGTHNDAHKLQDCCRPA